MQLIKFVGIAVLSNSCKY